MAHDEEHDIGPQEINAGAVALVGGAGAVVVVVLMVMTQIFFNSMQGTILRDKDLDAADAYAAEVLMPQQRKMSEYALVDAAKKRISMPIDKAMEATLAARAKNPRGPSGPPTPPPGAATPTGEKKSDPPKKEGGGDAKKS